MIAPLLVVCFVASGTATGILFFSAQPLAGRPLELIIAVIVLMVVALLVLSHLVLGRYRCPQCGERLSRYQKEPERKAEYRYGCPRCDIIWNTGIRKGNGEANH